MSESQNNVEGTYYGDYLQLEKLLDTQSPMSAKLGNEQHDETLFIIVHQVYELWFKQIIHEMHSLVEIFSEKSVDDHKLGTVVARLERINRIQQLLMGQLDVMETMTPMDFLEFRDLLVPASGFQSAQFREIEILMGLRTSDRKAVDREYFLGRLNTKDRERLQEIEKRPSILELVEKWLERVPFTEDATFNFWDEYKKTVYSMLNQDEQTIRKNAAQMGEKYLAIQLENLESTKENFETLLSSEEHKKLKEQGKRKLSQKAILNALFISLYRDEPILQQPYRFLKLMMDIDQSFTAWRYRHALMAQRMLGTKIGTGGSSGHQYLKNAADNNRVYLDLFNLSTFLIPRSKLPQLPGVMREKLNFHFNIQN